MSTPPLSLRSTNLTEVGDGERLDVSGKVPDLHLLGSKRRDMAVLQASSRESLRWSTSLSPHLLACVRRDLDPLLTCLTAVGGGLITGSGWHRQATGRLSCTGDDPLPTRSTRFCSSTDAEHSPTVTSQAFAPVGIAHGVMSIPLIFLRSIYVTVVGGGE